MSYWAVSNRADTLRFYIWADNAQHALRKIEDAYGGMPPQQTSSVAIKPEEIPEGDDVMDEPDMEREARTDAHEKEDDV